MCNDYGNEVAYAEYREALDRLSLPIRGPAAVPNLEPRSDIWPTEQAPVFRRCEDGVELAQLRWGFPAASAKGRPVINFKSEDRSFANSKRCIVPASHFFEFKGAKSPKEKYRFTLNGEPWFCFAGLWRPASDDKPESFTLLTTAPGADVAPIHNRQMVVLRPAGWKAWLDSTTSEAELLAPLPSGSLHVERVR